MEYSYEYDGNGNLITRYGGISTGTDAFSSLAGKTSYSYDSLQRIASATYADGFSESFTYDNAGNRIKRTFGAVEEVYRYDSRNRLLDKTLFYQQKPQESLITFYQYDRQGNTLSEVTRYLNKEEVHNRALTQSPYIDNDIGDWDNISKSLVSKENASKDFVSIKIYEYDAFQKTTKITVTSQKETSIQENFYDAEGLRYAVRENDRYTGFVTNGWSVINEVDESWNSLKRLVRGYSIIAAEDELNGYHYYHQNEHGDTELITGANGKIQNAYSYDVFGNIRTSQEPIENRYTYYGEQYDKISEQYYLRARFYNPAIARFTQEDEYRGDGLNLYAYCANNPVMYVDPSGYKGSKSKCATGEDQDGSNQKKGNNQKQDGAESSSDKKSSNNSSNSSKKGSQVESSGNTNEGGSDSNKKGSQTDSSSSTKNGKKDNPYNLSNEELQANMDKIYMSAVEDLLSKSADGTLFNGGPRQTTTITPEGTVVISQNSTTVNKQSVITAQQIYGDDIIVINSSKSNIRPGMEGNYGNHAETKGIYYLEKNGYPTEGVKQVSSHYSCDSCESVQKQVGIINVTGYASDNNNVQKRINYSEKD